MIYCGRAAAAMARSEQAIPEELPDGEAQPILDRRASPDRPLPQPPMPISDYPKFCGKPLNSKTPFQVNRTKSGCSISGICRPMDLWITRL